MTLRLLSCSRQCLSIWHFLAHTIQQVRRRPAALLAVAFILLTLLSACSTGPELLGRFGLGSGRVLFEDDFSSPDTGWDQISGFDGETNYTPNGEYRIFVNDTRKDVWANPGREFSNVAITVEAAKVGGPDQNNFGLICRYQDPDNFYFLMISSQGHSAIGKYKNGEIVTLSADPEAVSPAIATGAAINRLQAVCNKTTLMLSVNGEKLLEVEDTDFSSGDIGLLAGTFERPGADIHFDNIIVRSP